MRQLRNLLPSRSQPYPNLRVCKAKGCLTLFRVGEGGKKKGSLYCCNACKTAAHRSGGPQPQAAKIEEINDAYAYNSERLLAAQRHVEEVSLQNKAIVQALDVACRESWEEVEAAWETSEAEAKRLFGSLAFAQEDADL